jgi:predicted RNase H-like nuclease (RuvC/YqgF family)
MDISWVDIMDIAIATICATLVGVAGSIFVNWLGNRKGYRNIDEKLGKLDNQTLEGLIEQKLGKLDNQSLAGLIEQKFGKLDNQSLEGLIEQKAGRLDNTTLSGQHLEILKAVRDFQNQINSERKLASLKRGQLTGDQAKISQSIDSLKAFAHIMADLQSENMSLKAENRILKHEISLIQHRTQNREQSQDFEL